MRGNLAIDEEEREREERDKGPRGEEFVFKLVSWSERWILAVHRELEMGPPYHFETREAAERERERELRSWSHGGLKDF